jgi:hypothetical protein
MALSDLTTGPAPETRGISLTRPRTRPVRGSLAKSGLARSCSRWTDSKKPNPNRTVGAQRRVESMNGTENIAESSIASARASSVVVFDTRPGTATGYRIAHLGAVSWAVCMGRVYVVCPHTVCAVVFETVRRVFSKSDTSAPHAPPHVLHLITQEHLECYRSDRTPSPIRRSCSHDKVLIYMCIIIKLIDREDFAPSCRAALSCARRPGAAARSSSRPRAVQRPSRMLP